MSRRGLLRYGLGVGAAAGVGALGWARYVEPDWVQVEHLEVKLARLPRAFDGFRIAQVTDLHVEFGSMAKDWPSLAELVTRQGADLICLTGDYMSESRAEWTEAVAAGLRKLHAPLGVFATMGNHDYWAGLKSSRRALQMGGVRELNNEVHILERERARLALAGVDDMLYGRGDLGAVAAQVPAGTCSVLLCHEPDFADWAAPLGKFDFMMAGHAHGGQVCLPIAGALVLPPMGRKYWKGFYEVGGTRLYTSRGLGTVGIPLRFNARPEITVFTLRSV